MRLTFYSKESIVLLLNKTNLSNTIISYFSKLILTTFLLVLFTNVSFGNTDTINGKPSNYFSTQIHKYSKTLLTGVIEELESSQQEAEYFHEWTALYQQFSIESNCTNLLTNEEFDNGTDDWLLYVDGSTTATATWSIDNTNQISGTNAAHVNITNATGTSWDIQMIQENKSITAGKEYQVVFEAKAVAERNIVVSLQKNSTPWTRYGSQEFILNTNPQTYSFKFIASETNIEDVALIFHLAESTENIYIDNVRFAEACVAEICDNNIDDDGDGLIDNADSDCSSTVACTSCIGPNLFANPSFETGNWIGSEIFVPGVSAMDISNVSFSSLDFWGYGNSKWVESNKATDGNRFVYLNKDTDEPVCYSQRYTFGAGNEINDCDTYQICFDWSSFNSDFPTGRTTVSQPSVDFIFRDNANQTIKFISIPLGTATANQNWNNLIWESVSFAFKFEGNLTVPANTVNIDVLISESNGHDNGLLLDNTSLCLVNSCSGGCPVTNMYPGFALDQVGDNCNWLDYTLDNDLNFKNNGDGTATIAGKIVDGVDADWDGVSCTASPCGADDAWDLTLNLSNKQSWTELQAAGGTANVHTNCSTDNLDYWDVSGTLTGLGCNSGRTLTINSAASNYRLQIGYGGNSNDVNCDFGLSTWFNIEENGSSMQADIYAFLNASCYNPPSSCTLQFDNVTVSNCIDQPLMDVATVDATISWTSAPTNDTIEISIDNKTEYIDVAGGVTSPQTIRFTIPADGSTANNITVNWRNTTGCNQSTTYDAPSACSSNEIACDILYICGDDKPHDGDAWDHGWLEYLDAVNGSNTLTPAFSKADASGMGLYDPHNVANALTITLEDFDLIIVSATTEERLSNDLINALKNTSTSVLNSNFKIVNDLGLTATEATYAFQNYMYTDNTTRETLYSFNNKVNPSYGTVILKGNYSANADAYLWKETGNYNDATDGILFAYTRDDALSGVDATHGDRVFLGYHMNGNYANPNRSIPAPESLWFNPAKHLTLAGKMYLDSALVLAAANCRAVTPEICDDGIDNDGDGLTDCEDPDCKSIIVSKLSYSECVLTGAEYQATMSIEVSWTNPPAGEGINVITPDNSQFIDIVGGATSPYTVDFVIAADNSTNPLSIAYTGGNGCGFDSYYDAPAPCPEGTERNMPCTNGSGYVGGIVFEDLSGNGLQDEGEPGLEGIMVTATDNLGTTVGQTLTNNIGVFEFADLTDGDKFKLEFTAIPSGMYPTNGSTYKGTTVQYVDAPSCETTLGLLNPTTNACEATNTTILQNGYSVVACLPAGDDVTLAIKDITQLGTLWQTSANRNKNQFDNVPTIRMWETSDFEGEEIFSMAIDPRDGTIYAVASPLYGDGSNTASVIFEENIAPKVFKINPETGVVTRIAQLSGTLGLGAIDFDVVNEQLLITNMDDGKIYRLNTDGVVLNSYDPLAIDNGISSQLPNLGDRILGIAFNPIDKRVYYSVWSNHMTFTGVHENINNNYNTIRSVSLDADGDFIPSTDQLEMTIPYNPGHTVTLTAPTADLAFNRAGDRLLIAEFAIVENNSGSLSTAAHAGVVREFQKIAGVWTLEPTYGSNYQGKYDIGSVIDYRGRNSRGGVDWAYERVSGDTIFGDDDFIIATGDALHVASRDGDYIYGYQFTPATGGNIANSILVDLDNDLINPDKYVYSDVDIYKNYCAALTLEIGNYVWLDSDEDGVQDLYEVGLAGVNVTLYDAAGDSLTSVVTDANGAYYFNDDISGFDGLTPNTTYYIVVGRGGQFNKTNGALNFVFDLTVSSIGDGNYKDENDSDGVIGNPSYGHPVSLAGYPIIELTTGEIGQNDYSFDFGFKEICSAAIVVNDSIPTCPGVEYEGSVSLNDSNYEDKFYSLLTNPANGTVTMGTNGTFSYIGNTSTCISDQFSYQVCDPSMICCSSGIVYLDFADVSKPSLQNIPDNDTISCDEVVPLPPQIFAIDNCPGISLDVKEEDTQGEDGCSLYDYTITRTWTAIDICGNSTSASQVIEVQDVVAPDIYRVYTLPNGKKMVAGVMELVGGNWKTVSLPIDFDTKPIILHQVTTNDGLTPVVAQIQNVSVSQFELRIAAEEANTSKRARESVSWIAMEAGIQSTDYQFEMNSLLLSKEFKTVNFQNSFATTPAIFTSAQTTNEADPASIRNDLLTTSRVALKVQEETSNDTESLHLDERVGYLALEKIGDLRDKEGILLGEVGTISLDDKWTTITLNNTYANPVIIANSLSINGGEPATVRIQNVGLNSFEVKVEEWAYLDGGHGAETVSYMVVEGSIPLESPTYCDEGTDSLDIGIDFKAVDNCDVSVVINYTERDTFIGATKIITRTWSAEDECGNSTSYSQEIACQGVSLQLKSILQGAMLNNRGNGLMRDDLRKKGILPLEEPYAKMPFFEHVSTGGGEVMDANLLAIDGADGIVDWVFVELRDANDMENVVATHSVLIQCDGDIVTAKGDSIIHFTNTRIGDYFVALRHRNHLGLITLNTESFTPSTTPFVDFTFAFTPVVGSNPSIKVDNLESLWSGDLNGDGKVIYQGPNNDIFYMFLHVLQDEGNTDFLPNFISNRYTNDDFNLDGSVIYQGPNNDRAKLLFNTILRHPENPQKFSNFIIYRGEGN